MWGVRMGLEPAGPGPGSDGHSPELVAAARCPVEGVGWGGEAVEREDRDPAGPLLPPPAQAPSLPGTHLLG